ncbi:hypothetical protein N307_12995, partial [Dryobates pubescens]
NCKDDIDLWNKGEIIAASIFTPGAAAAKALMLLNRMSCCLTKQNNSTSEILSDLATEYQSIRHATSQNRAAIDFLLLVHGRECEDFNGMCCMNLTDKCSSIRQQIKTPNGSNNKDSTRLDPFFGLENIFDGWSLPGRIKSLIKTRLLILLIALVI